MGEITSERFIATMRERSVFAAVEELLRELGADVAGNAEQFHKTMLDAYWKRKDLAAVVALGVAGIEYALAAAAREGDAQVVNKLRSLAKGMSYDLGSFTWPGWNEPGFDPTAEQGRLGLHAARFNLQLAVELGKPADRVRGAQWLVGAQLLANVGEGSLKEALEHFELAVPEESDEDYVMFRGYVVLVRRQMGETRAEEEWEAIMGKLASAGTEGAKFAHGQLAGVQKWLRG